MIEEIDQVELVKELSKIFIKYNLKEISCCIYTAHPMVEEKIVDKDLLHLKIKDNHKFKILDSYFDVLEENK